MKDTIIKFEIVTPERSVFSGDVKQLVVPTASGEITILPQHIPLVATLQAGVLEMVTLEGKLEILSLSGGFLEVLKDKVVILADTAERAEEIDLQKAETARERASETMKKAGSSDRQSFSGMRAMIAKEMARTRAHQRWKRYKGLEK